MKVTTKYDNMIMSFSADFWLAKKSCNKLCELQRMIETKDPRLLRDIDLLEELESNLRHGRVKIFEV